MKNLEASKIIILAMTVLFAPLGGVAESWSPPKTINSETLQVRFEVDSTWHLIHGEVPNISGKIWLNDASDPTSIRGDLKAAVLDFDTDNKSRDKEMRHVMDADQFPNVILLINGFEGEPCSPLKVQKAGECSGALKGEIKIRDVSKAVSVPFTVKPEGSFYKVAGEFSIQWEEFGVEDPSILVAKLDETVKIKYQVLLNKVN
jgi:polyisoprenoid-binding protein YceI